MKIMLVCYSGMSTSMLVVMMKKAIAASEKFKDKGIVVEAWTKEDYMEKLEGTEIILLGPQVFMIKDEVKKTVNKYGYDIPVMVVDKENYGNMNAVPILKEAFRMIKENKIKQKE